VKFRNFQNGKKHQGAGDYVGNKWSQYCLRVSVEVLTWVTMKESVFWDVTSASLLEISGFVETLNQPYPE